MLNACSEQSSGSAYLNASYRLRPKWIGESQSDTEEMMTISKKAYESLLGNFESEFRPKPDQIGTNLRVGGTVEPAPDQARRPAECHQLPAGERRSIAVTIEAKGSDRLQQPAQP